MRYDLRLAVLLARAKRWFHQLRRLAKPWRWNKEPPCRSYDYTTVGPPNYKFRVQLLACDCGNRFYIDKEFNEDEWVRLLREMRN